MVCEDNKKSRLVSKRYICRLCEKKAYGKRCEMCNNYISRRSNKCRDCYFKRIKIVKL